MIRIIDANANRAREALRVMEEYARFVLDDGALWGDLKGARHDLQAVMAELPAGLVEAWRDADGDVGRKSVEGGGGGGGLETELRREGAGEVVVAAAKRLSEALRAIEEYGKTVSPSMAAKAEALRYRGYELERRLIARMGSGRAVQWKVCVLVTERLCRRPWMEVVEAAIAGGADCIQLREKDLDDGELLSRAGVVVARCRSAGVACVVNDRVDIAMAAGADGVHVGAKDLPLSAVRRVAGRSLLVGVSTSNLREGEMAVGAGADYCGLGPCFSTGTAPEKGRIAGPGYVKEFVGRFAGTAHLAIGGIDARNVREVAGAGACGVAVSAAVCGADDPGGVVAALREAVERRG